MVKIYTKTGDSGDTSLFGAGRVRKNNARVQAYGEIDELNSLMGAAGADMSGDYDMYDLEMVVRRIQDRLFVIGSMLATPQDAALYTTIPKLAPEDTIFLEVAIDNLSKDMPHLHTFILPGGSSRAAKLHVARAVCRRAERSIVSLGEETQIDPLVASYINRLSDLLFEMARWVNWKMKVDEIEWKGR
jgi:cob(I)alamin adenosyltransferase